MMRAKWRGFTLIELLVVVAIIALLISILLPSLSRARELSKRVVCSSNARAIGNACKIYAAEPWHNDNWPTPTFNPLASSGQGSASNIAYCSNPAPLLDYSTAQGGSGSGVTPDRHEPSDDGTDSRGQNVSTTRAFWMLIRTGETVPKTYICPSSGDTVDDTEEIDRYYDFKSIGRVSYGYMVPFGPFDTRPSEDVDTRMALIADKGPYASGDSVGVPDDINVYSITGSPRDWMRFNSFNHGGTGAGEGQNCFFADGHVDFEQTPIVGVDHDNIYTLMIDFASTEGRIWGVTPQDGNGTANPWPGQGTFGEMNTPGDRATTDSLIWP